MLHIRRYGDNPPRVTQEGSAARRMSESSEEKRNDKRQRQRNKFLSVFLGPKKKTAPSDKLKGQIKIESTPKAVKSPPEPSRIAKWQPMIPASTLRRSETMAPADTKLSATAAAKAAAPSTSARRHFPPERTDTSGSEEMARHQNFNQLRQKSQVTIAPAFRRLPTAQQVPSQ